MSDESFKRSQSLQIYLKENIAEERILLDVWAALKGDGGRKQNLFRSMLMVGFEALLEEGKIPKDVVERCDLDRLLERMMSRRNFINAAKRQDQSPNPVAPPYGYPYPQPPFMPQQPMPQQPVAPYPVYVPMPTAALEHERHPAPAREPAPQREATQRQKMGADNATKPVAAEEVTDSTTRNPPAAKAKPNNQEASVKKLNFDLM